MTDYQKYINALRKCANEHENDRTSTGHIIVSDLCRDTANLLEQLEQEPITKNDLGVDLDELKRKILMEVDGGTDDAWLAYGEVCDNISNSIDDFKADLPPVTSIRPKGHWIEEFNDIEGEVRFTCSNCKKYQLFGTDFCYHCGSDNRSEE